MGNYLMAYRGGGMAETDAEREALMAAWGAWFGKLGGAIVDPGNPFAGSASVSSDGSVGDSAGSRAERLLGDAGRQPRRRRRAREGLPGSGRRRQRRRVRGPCGDVGRPRRRTAAGRLLRRPCGSASSSRSPKAWWWQAVRGASERCRRTSLAPVRARQRVAADRPGRQSRWPVRAGRAFPAGPRGSARGAARGLPAARGGRHGGAQPRHRCGVPDSCAGACGSPARR